MLAAALVLAAGLTADDAALLAAACSWAGSTGVGKEARWCAPPEDFYLQSTRPGRFVEGDGELLVSMRSPCLTSCTGRTFVARRAGAGWERLAAQDGLVDDACLTLRGADGWDRVACVEAYGPKQGDMSHWLEVLSFRKGVPTRILAHKVHNGECARAEPPDKAEHDGDRLSDLAAGEAGSDTVLTLRLEVERGACDRDTPDPDLDAALLGTHVLRFIRSGADVVPDPPTAVLIDELGWKPESQNVP